MNSIAFRSQEPPPPRRRLTKKALQSPAMMSYAAFQRHRARVRPLRHEQWQGALERTGGVELADDVILLDKHGRRVTPPTYATLPINQLPQFQKK